MGMPVVGIDSMVVGIVVGIVKSSWVQCLYRCYHGRVQQLGHPPSLLTGATMSLLVLYRTSSLKRRCTLAIREPCAGNSSAMFNTLYSKRVYCYNYPEGLPITR